ncbi:hypothetical protein HXX76_014299 [Chlamydomonas incerta]|uniref:Uncharacterized protein n=1 Tax=Chlamydomonas incerta TaxID=51695 RepID=A0A835VT01_CHLIN|nr:hypothetical protein HXX76_014299 [Chlamydomonas incerta]|eukprot:KAG2424723.1 hypothetical protein HXX76_014299 [Chlamydomonas incerta]
MKLRELHHRWYKAAGRLIEKDLVKRALASAPSHLKPQCNQTRFQDILRQAFKEEEDIGDDEEPELLNHCRAVLTQCSSIPDAVAFIELHRAICGANSAAHSDSVAEPSCLVRLLEDSGALGLAIGCGFAKAAPMIKKMAADLLKK